MRKLFCAGLVLVMACGDDDGGVDAAVDATTDAGVDATTDVGVDAATDVGIDAGPPTANWRCLGDITWDAPTAATIQYTVAILDGLSIDPVADVAVRACDGGDGACSLVHDEGTTAADGTLTLTLPAGAAGFDGYFELTKDGFRSTIFQLGRPVTEDQTQPMRLNSNVDFSLQAAALSATEDPARGHIVMAVGDCTADTPEAGASILLSVLGRDTETLQFYLAGGLPDVSATETDDSGIGGFFNAVPGRVGLRVNQSTNYVGGVDNLLIRAGWLSSIIIGPSPNEGNWSCLGSVVRTPPVVSTVSFLGRVIDALTQAPIEGVAYRVCALADPTCASPLAEGTTAADGSGSATLPAGTDGFDGFVELTLADYRSMVAFFNPPLTRDVSPASPFVLPMFSTAAIASFTSLGRVTLDDTRGHAFVQIADCGGFNSTDVGAELGASTADAMSTRFYVDGVVPDTMSTTSLVGGFAGYFNLPAGVTGSEVSTTFTSTVMGTTSGTVDVFIREGWVHQVVLPPSP